MQLIEIEPYFWELYEDSENIYLNVCINMSAVSWAKTICLDKQTIQQYQTQGTVSYTHLTLPTICSV